MYRVSSRVCVGKLTSLVSNFAVEYTANDAQENQDGLEFSDLNQVTYANGQILWGRTHIPQIQQKLSYRQAKILIYM
jgi:hypothetical protein